MREISPSRVKEVNMSTITIEQVKEESFNLQGILDDINEQDTSFLDCKHKHMMKSGAPPDNRIQWFHKEN